MAPKGSEQAQSQDEDHTCKERLPKPSFPNLGSRNQIVKGGECSTKKKFVQHTD